VLLSGKSRARAVVHATDAQFIAGGAVILAVAMGVGRFAYTAILPAMERDAGLGVPAAGLLASANLLGYMVGALVAMHPVASGRRLATLRSSLAGVVLTTGLMALDSGYWLALRFTTGACSGLILVFASSIVLERAALARRSSWPPLFFSGVGLGIAFSGIATPVLEAHGGSRTAWIGIAVASGAAALVAGRWFVDRGSMSEIAESDIGAELPTHTNTFLWLSILYMVEAFAYIIPATFLVAIIAATPNLSRYAALSWVAVGLAAAFATFPWIYASERLGKAGALAIAFAIQAVGIAVLVFVHNAAGVLFSALALGGTFMAVTLFAAGLAREMFPLRTNTALSRLTVLYSIGQIAGPLFASAAVVRFHSYNNALLTAAVFAAIAGIVTIVKVRDPDRRIQATRGS